MARFGRTVRDSQGNTIPNATVKVYLAETLTFASIFSDADLTVPIDQATSPLINEDDGTYEFFVESGTYKIVVSHPSIPTETYDNVDIGFGIIPGANPLQPVTTGSVRLIDPDGGVTGPGGSHPRDGLLSLYLTDENDVKEVALNIQVIQRNNAGADVITKTGIGISIYTQPDNGGDTSGILIDQVGGGSGLSVYKRSWFARPSGWTNYDSSPQGAAEFGTTDQSHAVAAFAGMNSTPNRAQCFWARIDNAVSDGIIVEPGNAVFDTRLAFVVGSRLLNSAPVNKTVEIRCNGSAYFGTNVLAVDVPNSRVGVGTATPGVKLHAASSAAADTDLMVENTNAVAQFVALRLKNIGREWRFRVSNTSIFQVVDVNGAVTPLTITPASPTNSINLTTSGVAFFGAGSFGGGVGVISLANAGTEPVSTPTNAVALYSLSSRFKVREDATRFVVQAANSTKTTAGAPFANDGYVTLVINGTSVRVMTTA